MSLSSPSKRRSLLHSVDQEKLKRLFTAASGNCVVVTRLLNDDPSSYGLPETCSFNERSVRRFFSAYYPTLRAVPRPSHQVFHCYPGQQLQIDFIQARFQFDGQPEPTKIYIFEAVYRWSRKGFAFICPDMNQASWLMAISTCLMRYGLPQQILS